MAEDENVSEQQSCGDFLQPSDFTVGKEVNILGHRFLIRDCDARTRKYYEEILKVQQGDRIAIDKFRPIKPKQVIFFCSLIIFCVFFY